MGPKKVYPNIFDNKSLKKCVSSLNLLRNSQDSVFEVEQSVLESSQQNKNNEVDVAPEKTCTSCQCNFTDRGEQVAHYKSDWHRYNLKRMLRSEEPVDEESFNASIEASGDSSSISGSDSEPDDDSRHLQHQTIMEDEPSCTSVSLTGSTHDTSATLKLHLTSLDSDVIYSVHRCLVCRKKEQVSEDVIIDRVKKLLTREMLKTTIIMLSSGHFAAAVFENEKPIVHKTFHKYVVRAKQGTSQASSDNRGHKAKSAGANLRRHCEASLKEEVYSLLQSWSKQIAESDLIFIKISTENSSILFGGKHPILSKQDLRIRSIPFPMQRPTFSELNRVFRNLVQTTELDKEKYREIKLQRSPPGTPEKKLTQSQQPKKERTLCKTQSSMISSKLTETSEELLISRKQNEEGNCDSVEKIVEKEDEILQQVIDLYETNHEYCFAFTSTNIELLKSLKFLNSDTGLHYFSRLNDCKFIELLLDNDFDVNERNNKNKTPCQLVTHKKARNIFRKFRANYPEKFDYSLSGIPEPLDEEEEKRKLDKLAQKRKENKQKRKDAAKVEKQAQELERIEKEQKAAYLQLSDREKRALAAERRLGGTVSGVDNAFVLRCFLCAKNIDSLVPFKYCDNSFCSTDCVHTHRKASLSSK